LACAMELVDDDAVDRWLPGQYLRLTKSKRLDGDEDDRSLTYLNVFEFVHRIINSAANHLQVFVIEFQLVMIDRWHRHRRVMPLNVSDRSDKYQ
jgi:hypothetical protein